MKKIGILLVALLFCVSLSACGGKTVTFEEVTAAIQTVDGSFSWDDEKPYFEMVGADDGWIGYINGTIPVKVYQYESDKAYKDAVKVFGDLMGEWPKIGGFVLECKDTEVQNAFLEIDG